jgi:catecholate siderophore receptor
MAHRRRPSARARKSWFAMGALLGTLPAIKAHAAAPDPGVVLDRGALEAALAHVKVWTPGETLGVLPGMAARDDQRTAIAMAPGLIDGSDGAAAGGSDQGAAVFRFSIPAGPLASGLRQFETVTGLTVRAAADVIGNLTTEGVQGSLTASQALDRLLDGTSLSFRSVDATTFAVEIHIAADAVQVTAREARPVSEKYSAPLTETPQTIQVIPRTLLEEQGATTLSEALRNVPGITLQAGEGGGASNTSGDMFNMRGFSANNSLFVDNVRDDGMLSRDVFNLEQIEVYSGPTGSDVGRTNAAGYINLSTKVPQRLALRSGTLAYGSGSQVRATADINQSLAFGRRGTFFGNGAFRLNAVWQDGGVAGRDDVEHSTKAIAPSVAFGLGTPTRVIASAQIMRQDNLADYGLPAAASPVGPLTPASPQDDRHVDQSNYYGSPDYDYDHGRQDNVLFRVEHDFGTTATVRNQTRYNTTTREALVTSIQNPAAYNPVTNLVTLSRQANERHNDIFSNQTSLTARATTGRIHHDLSLGLEVSSEHQFAPTLTGVGTRAPVDLNEPDVHSPVVGVDIQPTGAEAEGRTNTVALYAFDGFDLGPRVRVNGGIRVEHYDTTSHSVTAAGAVTDIDGKDTLLSGKAGIVYRLNSLGNLYASYGSSVTPPGSANFQLNATPGNQNNPNVDPQESTNYEVGSKWDLAGSRLQLSGAYFWTENKNVIFVVDAAAVPPIFNQDDGQRVRGAALSVVGRITPQLDINFAVQYLDSEVKSQNPATDGHKLALTPEVSGSVWATYQFPRGIRAGGGVRYTDPAYISTANTTLIPRYAVADALFEAPLGSQATLRLNVYNLTDRVYIRNINNNAGRYNPGTPRSFLLSTGFRF